MDIGTGLTILGSAQLVGKVLGPTAEYIGDGLKHWTERRVANVRRIFSVCTGRLGDAINQPGAVPPRVLRGILAEGSFADDPLAAEYFGGVLASSRTDTGRDDRGVSFLSVVSDLSTYQLRSHYVFYLLFRRYFRGRRTRTMYGDIQSSEVTVFIPFDVYARAMGLEENESPVTVAAHSLMGLRRHDLVTTFAYGKPPLLQRYSWAMQERDEINKEGVVVSASPFGSELFMYVHGKADYLSENDFYSDDTELVEGFVVEIQEGAMKLTLEEKHRTGLDELLDSSF